MPIYKVRGPHRRCWTMEDERIVALFLRRDEAALGLTAAKRSEERRVGKECT